MEIVLSSFAAVSASCDSGITVAFDSRTVDSTGAFCFEAYTVQPGDCGEYKVNFGRKNDNYKAIPEFTSIGAGLALLGAGFVYLKRRRH